jgi:hypothetical protein
MRSQKGQGLVEALIALGVATLIVSAMAIAVITSVNSSDYSKYENLATHYAQQGMEILQQQSQSDWAKFSSILGTFCLGDDNVLSPGESSCLLDGTAGVKVAGFFVRRVNLVTNDAACPASIHGTVSVYWRDGKCSSNNYCHKVELESCFANINPAKTL